MAPGCVNLYRTLMSFSSTAIEDENALFSLLRRNPELCSGGDFVTDLSETEPSEMKRRVV